MTAALARCNSPNCPILGQYCCAPEVLPGKTFLLLLLLFTLCGCGERPVATYADYAAVEASSAIERGWIPANLPRDATQIREIHDIDTNSVVGVFHLPADSRQAFQATLTPIADDQAAAFDTRLLKKDPLIAEPFHGLDSPSANLFSSDGLDNAHWSFALPKDSTAVLFGKKPQ